MFGGVGKSAGLISLLAGGFVLAGSMTAQAADLGGNCCADLEERIAELEATTARKGNSKVKLTVYGKVNEAVMWWDDGDESNTYIVTNDSSRTRFGFKGGAKISGDWSANFRLEIGVRTANSKRTDQRNPLGVDESPFDIRHAWWNVKSKHWGTFQLGWTPTASQSVTEQNVAGTNDVGKWSDPEDTGGDFFLRNANIAGNAGLSSKGWRDLLTGSGDSPGEGDRRPAIYYVSPALHGFFVKAAWGGDDFWDVGLWYKDTVGTFQMKGAIAYTEQSMISESGSFLELNPCPGDNDLQQKCQMLGGSFSVLEKTTGLYANFAAGWMQDDTIRREVSNFTANAVNNIDDDYKFWAVEAGIQRKWHPWGATTFFGQYYSYDGGAANNTFSATDAVNSFNNPALLASSDVPYWGIGVMQKIDAAEMKLYSLYRHFDFDLDLVDGAGTIQGSDPLDDFQVLMTGAVIYF